MSHIIVIGVIQSFSSQTQICHEFNLNILLSREICTCRIAWTLYTHEIASEPDSNSAGQILILNFDSKYTFVIDILMKSESPFFVQSSSFL